MYIYIYTRPAAWTKRRIWIFSELTLAKFMVLPKRSTNVSLTKFESRSWIKQTPRSFPFSRSRTTNLVVLAENLSVTPPTPHDWSLRPMVLCLNRTGKRSEIYNLNFVGLQREDSPRKLPHPKKQRFNLPTPFTLWLSLGPPYRVFFFRKFLRHLDHVDPTASWAPQRHCDSCHRWSDVVARREPHWQLHKRDIGYESAWRRLPMEYCGCWWLNFQPAKSPRILHTPVGCIKLWDVYISQRLFTPPVNRGVFFLKP